MRIAHLSDLHFGRERPEVVEALESTIKTIHPDLVVVSGDLTQRARRSQFAAARGFLNRLEYPWLCVPGNHDVPLFNVWARMVIPLAGYKQWIHHKTDLGFIGQGAAVFGLSTAGKWGWTKGVVTRDQLRHMAEFFADVPAPVARVLVAHHPLVPIVPLVPFGSEENRADLRDVDERIQAFCDAGVDLILSGHMHANQARLVGLERDGRTRTWLVLAGTAVSARERGESNSFNELKVREGTFQLRVHTFVGAGAGFRAGDWVNRPLARHSAFRLDAHGPEEDPLTF
jgi:3',5'-cyclic AMP phosphodiesterase CpdA